MVGGARCHFALLLVLTSRSSTIRLGKALLTCSCVAACSESAFEIKAELGGQPDLIIGNYSDGNLVASLLSHRMHVRPRPVLCAFGSALALLSFRQETGDTLHTRSARRKQNDGRLVQISAHSPESKRAASYACVLPFIYGRFSRTNISPSLMSRGQRCVS